MKILGDESIEAEIVEALRQSGHEVTDIKETTPGIADRQVLSVANESGAVLLTNDKDFGELIFRDRLFSKGVVLLRFGKLEAAERIELLRSILEEHRSELSGAFTVITSVGVRIRR